MASIRYTHGFDLIHQYGRICGSLMLLGFSAVLVEPAVKPIERFFDYAGLTWLFVILAIGLFFSGLFGSAVLLEKTIWPSWLPSYCYVRLSLRTPITAKEAEKVGFLFDGTLGGSWYPLKSIKKLDPEFRKEFLFRFANKIAQEYGWVRPFTMPEDRAREAFESQRRSESNSGTQSRSAQSTGISPELEYCSKMLGLTGLPSDFAQVKQAYRRKVREFHPDMFAGENPDVIRYAEEATKRINVAYALLEKHYAPQGQPA